MNISRLRTLVAIHTHGGFTAAAAQVNLSQSSVSIQMKQLELELGGKLFVPGKRPAMLTAMGHEAVDKARAILQQLDGLRALGASDSTGGKISIGFVPTTLQTLLPKVLFHLQHRFPMLSVSVRSGLSSELGQAVAAQELDFAFLTSPAELPPHIALTEIAEEPLLVIDNGALRKPVDDLDILRAQPYIAFSRKTWLGRQIDEKLAQRGFDQRPPIELDSIDAIEKLVILGLGASIVPQRFLAAPLAKRLRCTPFGAQGMVRRLTLASHRTGQRETLRQEIVRALHQRTEGYLGRFARNAHTSPETKKAGQMPAF
jgi:DNA-binding transcriptional LysR family regulator